MSTQPTPLTERQRFWLRHLHRCGEGSLSEYAAANGLAASSLYEARSRFKRLGLVNAQAPVRLVRVEPHAAPSPGTAAARCRITLRNGAVIELSFDTDRWPALLAGVAALP